jgi:hypothetical protein
MVGRHAIVFVTTNAERLQPALSLLVQRLALPIIGKPFEIGVLLEAVRIAEGTLQRIGQ